MRRFSKVLAVVVILLVGAGFYLRSEHTFRQGPLQAIAAEQGLSPRQKVVQAAMDLRGVLYDFSGGRLLSLGLLVCTDVPRLAYEADGIDLDRLMTADWRLHAGNYARFAGNNPSTAYFARRVENQRVFFSDTGRLIRHCTTPEPGDTVFYGDAHVAMVVAVYPDHTYDELDLAPGTVFATIHHHKTWVPRDVGRFGRLQGSQA